MAFRSVRHILAALLLLVFMASGALAVQVRIMPAATSGAVGSTVTLTVEADTVADLGGFQFRFTYSAADLQVVSTTVNPAFDQIVTNDQGGATGSGLIAATVYNNSSLSGTPVTLATINFKLLNPYAGNITLSSVILGKVGGAEIPATSVGGTVTSNIISNVDVTAPVITSFTIEPTSTTLSSSITSLIASDNVSVTGYLFAEIATSPPVSDQRWLSATAAPATYLFHTWGNHMLYVFARDAANNVSAAQSAPVYIGIKAAVDGVIIPAPDTATTKIEPVIADALKSLKFAMKEEIPDEVQTLHGDVAPLVNGVPQPDGVINLGDTIVILRRVVGL